jgi:hypothetical protein
MLAKRTLASLSRIPTDQSNADQKAHLIATLSRMKIFNLGLEELDAISSFSITSFGIESILIALSFSDVTF